MSHREGLEVRRNELLEKIAPLQKELDEIEELLGITRERNERVAREKKRKEEKEKEEQRVRKQSRTCSHADWCSDRENCLGQCLVR